VAMMQVCDCRVSKQAKGSNGNISLSANHTMTNCRASGVGGPPVYKSKSPTDNAFQASANVGDSPKYRASPGRAVP
jgi:hypothetical protein